MLNSLSARELEDLWREMIAVPERLRDLETEATGGARPSGAVRRLDGENGLRLKEMLAPGGAAPEPGAGFATMNVEELRGLVYGW